MFLFVACLLLLGVIALQDYKYPQLRGATISDGLYNLVPDHWMLDAAFVAIAAALAYTACDTAALPKALAWFASGTFMLVAASNTFSVWVDKVTGGLHNKIHTYATIAVFAAVLSLEGTQDKNNHFLVGLSAAGVLLPVASYIALKKSKLLPGPFAEKLAVTLMCAWLSVWSMQWTV
jgi:hypothetical protein